MVGVAKTTLVDGAGLGRGGPAGGLANPTVVGGGLGSKEMSSGLTAGRSPTKSSHGTGSSWGASANSTSKEGAEVETGAEVAGAGAEGGAGAWEGGGSSDALQEAKVCPLAPQREQRPLIGQRPAA